MLIALLLLSILFPFLYKYSFVTTNQYISLPVIKSLNDPNFLVLDWFVKVNKAFGPRTIFNYYIYFLHKFFSLPVIYFIHYLLYIFLISFTVYKFSYKLFQNKSTAFLTTITLLFAQSYTIGGNLLITRDFSATQLSLAICIFSLYLIFEEKYYLGSLILAISTYFHAQLGFETFFLMFLTVFIFRLIHKKKFVSYFESAILYLLLTIPAIILYLPSIYNSSISSYEKIAILAYFRTPHHYIPSSWPFTNYFMFFLILISASFLLFQLKPIISRSFYHFLFILVCIVLGLCIIGYVGTEIFPFYPVILAQLFRLTLYIYFICSIIIYSFCFQKAFKNRKLNILFLAVPLLFSNIFSFSNLSKINILILIFACFLLLSQNRIKRSLFIVLTISYFSLFHYHDKLNLSNYFLFETDETHLAKWARQNTSKDSIFLVPPQFEKFRLISERAIIADWKGFVFQDKYMLEWAEKMCDIANMNKCNYQKLSGKDIIKGYLTHDYDSFLELQKKHPFTYAITSQELDNLNPVFYLNDYKVYSINKK